MHKSFGKILLPLLAIAGLLLLIAWVAGVFTDKQAPGMTSPPAAAAAEVFVVIREERPAYEPVAASIQAKQATIISSRILSRIEKINVRAGDTVNQGQLLLTLEENDLQSRLSQAKATINAVSARLTEARQSLERARELTKTGMISRADLDKAQSNHDALVAELVSAQQRSGEAEAALGYARIYAPIDGRVVDRFAEPGDTVQPGVHLLSLYNPLTLRVEANIREGLALSLSLGQSLEIYIPATNSTLRSELEELVPAGNPGSRSFLVKSRLPYNEGLLPGMYARMEVPAGLESLLLIPADSVVHVGQLDVVWMQRDGRVERRFIRIGKVLPDGLVEVVSGLDEGDRILRHPAGEG